MNSNTTLFLDKMPARLDKDHVSYFMCKSEDDIAPMSECIGYNVSMEYTGRLRCIDCKKIVKKFYAPGLCYICMMSSALNSPCIINPELCEAHLGKGKVPEWEEKHHNQPHIVYLANSGGLKVGVTRADQIPIRWIDQGADEAIIFAHTPYRQLAGLIEIMLKKVLSDKTNWRAMLKNVKNEEIELLEEKRKYSQWLIENQQDFEHYISEDDTVYQLNYPTTVLSSTIQSVKLDKVPKLEGVLTGIKGQYLIFDEKTVLNIRSHAGYEVQIIANN
ncbi:MAG: DUF2797 domain-containing protein [Chitinophagales bacterium]|nr:DUF2797 domain-containing protein [Sphingobacteriales bacterium]